LIRISFQQHQPHGSFIYSFYILHKQQISIQFGDVFDQVKASEGYADDEEYSQPYRFLEHWYLVERGTNDNDENTSASTTTSFKRRLPLPPNFLFSQDKAYVIAGWLQPCRSSSSSESQQDQSQPPQEQQAIFVELTEMEFCSFDRSKLYRGYWAHTPEALYWLRQPDIATGTCTDTDTDTETSPEQLLPSQDQVHLPARTQLAVLSNVLDHVLLSPNAVQWAKKTVSQVHKEWDSAQHADTDTDMNVKEPFNKVLLAKYKTFVVQHLVDPCHHTPFHPAYTAKSPFIKTLKLMNNRKTSAAALATPEQLLAWTVESEAASQQYPWGESTVPIGADLGDALDTTLSESSSNAGEDAMTTTCSMNGQLEQLVKESEEIINATTKIDHGNTGDSEMMSIKLVVEGAPLPDILKLPTADGIYSNHSSRNGSGDNSDYDMKDELDDSSDYDMKDELDDGSDSGDESYEEATTGKRPKKLSKKKPVTKKRVASSHAAKERPVKKVKVPFPNDLWSPDRAAKALVRKIILFDAYLFDCQS
jgi:hypothetical protein